jgi:hypothetical protein
MDPASTFNHQSADKSCGVAFDIRGLPAGRALTEKPMNDEPKRPLFDAFVVDGDGKDAFWNKIGAAWPHDDAKGYNVQLTALPVTGRVVLRVPKERTEKPEPKARDKK